MNCGRLRSVKRKGRWHIRPRNKTNDGIRDRGLSLRLVYLVKRGKVFTFDSGVNSIRGTSSSDTTYDTIRRFQRGIPDSESERVDGPDDC